jgi:hypothetical protein
VRSLLVLFAAALAAAALLTAGASANGSPYSPGLVYGYPGVGLREDGLRYVAFGMPKSTLFAAVRARDGRVLRTAVVKGFYGVPLVAYDGTAGGLSGNGRWLVVSSYGPPPGASGKTNLAVLDTRTFKPRRLVVLDGSWSFDAVSPDASTLFLTQHLRAGDDPLYRVRTYDVRTGLLRGALVDRLEGESDMGGTAVARASSAEGRWAYTLYARRGHEPFIHALDTMKREAYCIDLPLALRYDRQFTLRLTLRQQDELRIAHYGGPVLATVDTDSWKVKLAES